MVPVRDRLKRLLARPLARDVGLDEPVSTVQHVGAIPEEMTRVLLCRWWQVPMLRLTTVRSLSVETPGG